MSLYIFFFIFSFSRLLSFLLIAFSSGIIPPLPLSARLLQPLLPFPTHPFNLPPPPPLLVFMLHDPSRWAQLYGGGEEREEKEQAREKEEIGRKEDERRERMEK